MEGHYVRGTRRVGAYSGGANDASGGNASGASFASSIIGFLSGIGPEGAVIAGFVQSVFDMFSGGPSEWENAGEGVHAWYTQNGEEELKHWARANYPASFGSVDNAKAIRMLWIFLGAPTRTGSFLVAEKGTIQGLAEPRYMLSTMAKATDFWASLGVDLPRTITNREAQGGTIAWIPPNHIVPIPGYMVEVDTVIAETIEAVANGEALTDEQADVAEGLLEESDAAQRQDRTITVLSAAAALVTLAR